MSEDKKPVSNTGYTGFRPSALKPGPKINGAMSAFVSDPRQTKFRRSAVEIIEPNNYVSNSSLTQNSVKRSHYMNRPAPVKTTEKHNNPAKSFGGISGSASDFINFQEQIRNFIQEDPNQYKNLFQSIDSDQNGFLSKRELHNALQRRNSTSQYITDTVMAHFDANSDGRVSWQEFRVGLERAKDQLVQSVNFKQVSSKAKPLWEQKQSKEIRVVSNEERPSMAQADYTEGGFSSHPLTQGTPQGTQHIPGYSGHLPSTKYNDKAVHQASGANCRSDKNELILVETYNPRVKAFTEVRYGGMKTMNSINDQLVTNMWDSKRISK